jgi:uncharacterized protein YbjT (DUF2867 family)
MVLMTGATGAAGSRIARTLLDEGLDVRVLVRDAERAERLLGGAAEIVVGDLGDPGSVRAALGGIEQLVLSGPDDPRRVGWETAAIDAAAAAGVRRVVRVSTVGAAIGSSVALWDWHGRVDEHLRRSPVAEVVLRPGPFMTNVLAGAGQVAGEGVLVAPAGDARMALIDPRDIGAAVAAVLTAPGHDGRTYRLTGPEAITYAEVAEALTAATGRDVRFVDVPDAAALEGLRQAGLPASAAEQVVAVFGMLRRGAAQDVSADVELLTGRAPRTFADWAREHAEAFAPVGAGAGR